MIQNWTLIINPSFVFKDLLVTIDVSPLTFNHHQLICVSFCTCSLFAVVSASGEIHFHVKLWSFFLGKPAASDWRYPVQPTPHIGGIPVVFCQDKVTLLSWGLAYRTRNPDCSSRPRDWTHVENSVSEKVWVHVIMISVKPASHRCQDNILDGGFFFFLSFLTVQLFWTLHTDNGG